MRATLRESSKYRNFVAQRDQVLERIHQNTQIDLSRILFNALEQIEHLASSLALKSEGPFSRHQDLGQHFENGTRDIFSAAFPLFVSRIHSMRRSIFIITYASEQEAIGRATQKPPAKISKEEFKQKVRDAVNSTSPLLGPVDKRIWLALMTLRRRVIGAFDLALAQSLKPLEIVAKVTDSFPPIRVYKRTPKELTRLKEAKQKISDEDDDKESFYDFDFIDDSDWDTAVDAYTDTEIPPNRFDNSASWDSEDGVMKYEWEMEQDTAEDFVQQVRDGQVDAANDLGVKEFVWVAVLDDKTCDECCLPRNGKTSSEIEAGLDESDDCDALTPPAHFNCRCQIAPVASEDEVEGPDWQGFNEWLEAS